MWHYATVMLGDMGADVIKVEPPQGDLVRSLGPGRHADMGAIFMHANRSKRSIVLDLKQPEGREALLRLARTADVLRSEEHTSELQSLMRISSAVFCLKKQKH